MTTLPLSQQRTTFVNDATADTTSGFPQVSILTIRKQKELAKKRREALITGKSYRAIGSHRRNAARHTWVQSELLELCATFMQDYGTKAIWRIAREIHASFATELNHIQHHQYRCAYVAAITGADADATREEDCEQPETRAHLPTVAAIELKLMDCLSLKLNDTRNNISKPSQMHRDVWSHLMLSQKHRAMIREMSTATATATTTTAKPNEVKQEVQQPEPQNCEIWNVHASEFMYENEDAFPSAKRRKLNPNEDDFVPTNEAVGEIEMGDVDHESTIGMDEISDALDEIAGQIDEREHNRRCTQIAVSACLAEITTRDQQIVQLLRSLRSAASEIDIHRDAIARKVAEIKAIVDPAPPAYAAAAAAEEESSRIDEEEEDQQDYDEEYYEEEEHHDHRPNMYGEYELDYDSDLDGEPPRGGGGCGYDHGEECS
jgi:hypothetical protein